MIRANSLYSRELETRLKVTGPQLAVLRQTRKDGSTTPSELAEKIHLSQATISGILDRLELNGLIKRTKRPDDRRVVLVKLTPKGKKTVSTLPEPLHENFAASLKELPEPERATMTETLERVADMMDLHGA